MKNEHFLGKKYKTYWNLKWDSFTNKYCGIILENTVNKYFEEVFFKHFRLSGKVAQNISERLIIFGGLFTKNY